MSGLAWKHFASRDIYVAACGSQLQGRVLVWLDADGWRWSLDMLPDDQEPAIRSTRGYARAQEAIEMAEAQDVVWPTLVRDAERS